MSGMSTEWNAVVAFGSATISVIYDYQALIAGLLAIAAAFIAAWPVWRQLNQMRLQTNAVFREFLLDRIRSMRGRRKWFAAQFGTFEESVARRIHAMEQFGDDSIDTTWAFEKDQEAGRLLDQMRQQMGDELEIESVEIELQYFVEKLEILRDTLDAIHRPYSMDRHDPDYSFSDEEWARIEAAACQAEKDLFGNANIFSDSLKRLDRAYGEELDSLRERMQLIDHLLVRSRP